MGSKILQVQLPKQPHSSSLRKKPSVIFIILKQILSSLNSFAGIAFTAHVYHAINLHITSMFLHSALYYIN